MRHKTTLHVMSYNIHGGIGLDGRRDFARLYEIMDAEGVDIALLQEVETRPSRGSHPMMLDVLQQTRFPYRSYTATMPGRTGWYGNLVLSRYPVVEEAEYFLSAPGKPLHYQDRHALECVIDTPAGAICVINTHLGVRWNDRRPQGRNLLDVIAGNGLRAYPVLLMGDFNEWMPQAGFLRKMRTLMTPVPLGPSFPSFFPVMHLDRIWCRPAGLIRRARTVRTPLTRVASDHLPVVADIVLQAEA